MSPFIGEWWFKELDDKKINMIRVRNIIRKANPIRKPFVIEEYLKAMEDYKQAIHDTF